jgi:mannose-6-phosphate isomerase-like protein (cupin superfamily)
MAMTQTTTTWRSGWDVDNPLDIETGLTRKADGSWAPADVPGLEQRDLGMAAATDGGFRAQHLRVQPGASVSTDWQFHDADFQWIFVLAGELRLRFEDGTEEGTQVRMSKRSSAYQPPYWRYRIESVSPDFEAVEVFGPSPFETVTGLAEPKPEAAAAFAHLEPVYTHDTDDQYVRGDGPRAWSLYRDLGTRGPTDGRVHIHIIALDEKMPSPEGGTGDHHHSMAQFFMPIRGWIDIAAEGRDDVRVFDGDFMMVSRGTVHNAFDASPDYMTLEFCVPADYDTVAR